MNVSNNFSNEQLLPAKALEVTIRIASVGLLLFWCLKIGRPFIEPVVWGIIIAVAIHPLYSRLESVLGGRGGLAATLITLLAMALLIVPTIMLSASLVNTAYDLAAKFNQGTLNIPVPPEGVRSWPVIGERLYDFWGLASNNLEVALSKISPQIKALGGWLLPTAASAGIGILRFVVSIIIAGALLAHSNGSHRFARVFATRLAGERGPELVDLARATVRSVAQGVLGVAIIQAILAGLGFLVVGVPAAGLWSLLVLLVAVVQIPPLLILIPIIIYVFSVSSTTTAVVFMIWGIFVSISDAFLKPLMLGRGVQVPMLVVLVGAIGGLMLSGIIGLFLGAVILALGYQLFKAWLNQELEKSNVFSHAYDRAPETPK
ncbi:MAG: AI-2E family transporter [Desulfoferrobacter sp.]